MVGRAGGAGRGGRRVEGREPQANGLVRHAALLSGRAAGVRPAVAPLAALHPARATAPLYSGLGVWGGVGGKPLGRGTCARVLAYAPCKIYYVWSRGACFPLPTCGVGLAVASGRVASSCAWLAGGELQSFYALTKPIKG